MTPSQIARAVKKGVSFEFKAGSVVLACERGAYPTVQLPMSVYETMSSDVLITAGFAGSEEGLITFVFIESDYYAGNFRNAWACFQEALEEVESE